MEGTVLSITADEHAHIHNKGNKRKKIREPASDSCSNKGKKLSSFHLNQLLSQKRGGFMFKFYADLKVLKHIWHQ